MVTSYVSVSSSAQLHILMMQFKEVAFIRLKRQSKQTSQFTARSRIEELKQTLKGLLEWSFHIERHQLKEVFMNYESKAIYNNGIIVRRQSNESMVEIVSSVPREGCTVTLGTQFAQQKNYINYTFEQAAFHADPVPFFESMGYKVQSSFEYKDVEYFRSLAFGVEVVLYPKHAYLQVIETYNNRPELDNHQSAGNQLLRLLISLKLLDDTTQVILSSVNMKPVDFLQEFS